MATRRMAVVGNSHVLTLFEGYQLMAPALPPELEITFIAKGQHRIGYAVVSATGIERPAVLGTVVELVARLEATHVFVAWQGSEINVRSLLQQGPPFDVLLPSEAERAVESGVELIPCSAVETVVRAVLYGDQELSELIGCTASRGAKAWLMCPPPALPEEAVRDRLMNEPHFAERLQEIGMSAADVRIVPQSVRVRLRMILLRAYREYAALQNACFCPPPDLVADASGTLLPDYWGRDITHGSAAYGAAYLRELVAVAGFDRD